MARHGCRVLTETKVLAETKPWISEKSATKQNLDFGEIHDGGKVIKRSCLGLGEGSAGGFWAIAERGPIDRCLRSDSWR